LYVYFLLSEEEIEAQLKGTKGIWLYACVHYYFFGLFLLYF